MPAPHRRSKSRATDRSVRPTTKGPHRLALYEFGKHFFGVDGDEGAAAAGQDFVVLVANFGFVDVLAALDADFPALDV
jgi:hypothetical protein